MASKDLHENSFDESTIAKLEIFEDYAEAWIPAFIMQGVPTLCIFDFFAGPGYDKNGVSGSPIRILQKINGHIDNIHQKKAKVIVYLNEFEPKKFEMLKKACTKYLEENQMLNQAIKLNLYNRDFKDIFFELLPSIQQYPSLVYLDQNGIKFLSDIFLLELEKTSKTDFLYFVSSSYIGRFGETEEFKKHLNLDISIAKKEPYKFIHRNIIDQLRKKLPDSTKLKLYPFSLKKGANIYGIIFGASHPRAVDKFLSIAWKRNETNGEANFDIDDDAGKAQDDLFEKKLTKIEQFKENVKKKVLAEEITNNFDLYNFTLEEGHIGKHAAECLKEMKKKGEITFDGKTPLVTYDNVYKNKKKITYKLIKNETQ